MRDGKQLLNYADFEFEQGGKSFQIFDRFAVEGSSSFAEFIKGKKVVDFACGGGGKSVYLASVGADEVVGIDMNRIFIEQAHEIAGRKGVSDRCRFLCESASQTSLPDAMYDVVILNDAIDHIEPPEAALREAHRILKPGGRIFINFESYFYFWGHHLLDAIRIPWLHLFTTEAFRIALYKEAVKKYPDAQERIDFRISKDGKGMEHITYLNHLTLRRFRKILAELKREGLVKEHSFIHLPRRWFLKPLALIPYLREMFISTILVVLRKEVAERLSQGDRRHTSLREVESVNQEELIKV